MILYWDHVIMTLWYTHTRVYFVLPIQWNSSNPDTIGPEESVLIRDVSLFQGLKSTQTWDLGGRKCPD